MDNTGQAVNLASITPNSNNPLVIEESVVNCAFIIGTLSEDMQWWAVNINSLSDV